MINEKYDQVKASKEFKDYQKSNPKAYLVHLFYINEPEGKWQVGFWENGKAEMTSFILDGDNILVQPEKDVLQREQEPIQRLLIENVKQDYDEIKEIAEKTRKEKYPKEWPLKEIYVLQNLKDVGQVWNITIFSKSFKTVNIKIDALTGEVKAHDVAKLFDMEPGEAGLEKKKKDRDSEYIG
jgi:hypothetical protein